MNHLTRENLSFPVETSLPNTPQSLQQRFHIQAREEYNDYAPPSYEELFGKWNDYTYIFIRILYTYSKTSPIKNIYLS